MPGPRTEIDSVPLIKKVEDLVAEIEQAGDERDTIHTVTASVIDRFRAELGLHGGRLYRRHGDVFTLEEVFGGASEAPLGIELPATYAAIESVLDRRVVYMEPGDPRLDGATESRLGAREFAAVTVGEGEWILAFDVAPGAEPGRILYSLGILRHSINLKLRSERLEEVLREARRIQASILPRRMPRCGSFEICCRSEPLHSVGGDHYDYIQLTDKILGLAIADVSGHGLPAALQVRDVYMGLRMGLSRDLKIVRVVEMLNQLIRQSTLTSRFVSLFYGELEPSGIFIYVNAGHPAPFFVAGDGRIVRLDEGGAVLGPIDGATYERGFVRLQPGDLMVLFTDGIPESPVGSDAEYGEDRLLEVVRAHAGAPAKEIVAAVFDDLEGATGGRPQHDDRTLMVVRWPP